MYRIIGIDGRQYGPIAADQLREWIAAGRANGQTLTQTDGSTDWKPLSEFPEFAAALAAKAAGMLPPLTTLPVPVNPEALAGEILARDYRVDIGSCLGRSWDLLMKNFGLVVGASFVVGLIQGAVGLLGGVCMGGLYFMLLKLIRGEKAEFGDAFAGFSLAFLQLFLAGLVRGLLTMLGLVLCILPGIYLAVAWVFAVPLVMDKRMDFWPAMELSRKVVNKHWWAVFGLLLISILVILVGVLACCVGVFVAQPLVYGAIAYAYEDIFGSKRPTAA